MNPKMWSRLSEDLIEQIVKMLPFRAMLRFKAVCRRWKELIEHPSICLDACRKFKSLPWVICEARVVQQLPLAENVQIERLQLKKPSKCRVKRRKNVKTKMHQIKKANTIYVRWRSVRVSISRHMCTKLVARSLAKILQARSASRANGILQNIKEIKPVEDSKQIKKKCVMIFDTNANVWLKPMRDLLNFDTILTSVHLLLVAHDRKLFVYDPLISHCITLPRTSTNGSLAAISFDGRISTHDGRNYKVLAAVGDIAQGHYGIEVLNYLDQQWNLHGNIPSTMIFSEMKLRYFNGCYYGLVIDHIERLMYTNEANWLSLISIKTGSDGIEWKISSLPYADDDAWSRSAQLLVCNCRLVLVTCDYKTNNRRHLTIWEVKFVKGEVNWELLTMMPPRQYRLSDALGHGDHVYLRLHSDEFFSYNILTKVWRIYPASNHQLLSMVCCWDPI